MSFFASFFDYFDIFTFSHILHKLFCLFHVPKLQVPIAYPRKYRHPFKGSELVYIAVKYFLIILISVTEVCYQELFLRFFGNKFLKRLLLRFNNHLHKKYECLNVYR